jgi:hypothetical protein
MIVLVGVASGCGSHQGPVRQGPLLTGKLQTGTFWKNPLTAPSNEGNDKGSVVEIFDQFIVVTTPDGLSHVYPPHHCSGLTIKRD